MNTIPSRIVICGALLIVTLISGVVMAQSGKSTNTLIFTVHKLIALGTVILFGIGVYNLHKAGGIQTLHIAAFSATGLFFLALIVSGGLLSVVAGTEVSMSESTVRTATRIHQLVPLLALVATMVSLYLLVRNKS
jgi:hypothetical protein